MAHQPSPENSQQIIGLKLMAGIAKSTTTPAHVNRLLIGSHRSDQASTHPLTKRGTATFSRAVPKITSLTTAGVIPAATVIEQTGPVSF